MPGFRLPIRAWVLAPILGFALPALATPGIDWPSLANTVVRTVAPTRDMQTPTAALAFAEDRTGFLWGGGESGLFRWDGYQFRFYTASGTPQDGLRNHYVWALHRDRGGRLWVGTAAGGLARYDDTTDRFQPVKLADRRGEANCVWAIDDDGAGGLWVGTNRGVAHLGADGRIVPPRPAAGAAVSDVFLLPERKVEALVRDRAGDLWIGGADGLARIAPDGRLTPISVGGMPQVSRLLQDSAGRLWAGTRHRGAFVIDPVTLRAQAVPIPAGLVVQEGGLEIMAMEEVEPGRIWLGTFGQGVIDVNAAGMSSRSVRRDPLVPGTLDSNLIYGLHRDRSGLTWISTTAALDQFVPPSGGLYTLFGNPARPDGLPADITAVVARPDGSVWLASENDGVLILGADGKQRRRLAVPRVFCMAAEADGPVYIGTRSGLYMANSAGDNLRKIHIASRRDNAGVLALAAIDGVVWAGGSDDDGLWELDPDADGSFAAARHFAAGVLPNASIHALQAVPGGKLAVGTEDGMVLLDRVSGAIETVVHDPSNPRSLMAGQIDSFLTDGRGRLWIGTTDGGIDVMLGRDTAGRPMFHPITTADGLPDADSNRLIADRRGRVWVSTDNGLAVIDPAGFSVHALKEADGVAIPTYWNGSGARTPQGDILFGGLGGLTVIRPETVESWRYRPTVALSDIHVGGKPVRERRPELVITPDANSLAVEFSALDFSAPNRNLYRYKLDGFDADYVVTDAQHRVAAYTNLRPGAYTLRVQGSNRDGDWAEPATLAIRVLPAWFQTIFCHVAEVVALVWLGAGAMQGRTVWLRRRQKALEALVQERTAELVISQEKLTRLAYVDTLTGLPNRRSFNDALHGCLQTVETPPQESVLILIDLDGFKRVNDTLGHDAGDALLVIAATRLRAALRAGDFVARLGGDEFAILLGGVGACDVARQLCDRVIAGMTAPIEIGGRPVKIGASLGAARFPDHGRTAEELYKHADQALYSAKRSGKGVWCWYEDTPLQAA